MDEYLKKQKEAIDRIMAEFNRDIDAKGEPDWAAEPEQ